MKTAGYILGLTLVTTLPCWAVVTVRLNNTDSGMQIGFPNDPHLTFGTGYVELSYSYAGMVAHTIYSADTQKTVFALDANGFFDAGIGVLPEADSSWQVYITLRAWQGNPNWNSGLAINQEMSSWTQTTLGSWDPQSGLPPSGPILNIPSPIGTPEPSTLALGGLGACLLFSRLGWSKWRSQASAPCHPLEESIQPSPSCPLK